jgi:hypothetical protein
MTPSGVPLRGFPPRFLTPSEVSFSEVRGFGVITANKMDKWLYEKAKAERVG